MQSMATDMRRLNMALEVEEQGGRRVPSSPSVCSMQTDNSNGCASPAVSDCFNPFDCPSVQSRGSPRPPLGGMCAASPLLEDPIAAITGHPAYALRIALDRKGIVMPAPFSRYDCLEVYSMLADGVFCALEVASLALPGGVGPSGKVLSGPAAPAVSPSKWVPGGGAAASVMSVGPSSLQCRTPLPRPTPYRRSATPTCEPGERLPPSPTDPQLSVGPAQDRPPALTAAPHRGINCLPHDYLVSQYPAHYARWRLSAERTTLSAEMVHSQGRVRLENLAGTDGGHLDGL